MGWIHFTLDVGNQSTDIAGVYPLDPFPDLIRWLRIVTGHRRCVFTIDMEGAAAEFVAADRAAARMFRFTQPDQRHSTANMCGGLIRASPLTLCILSSPALPVRTLRGGGMGAICRRPSCRASPASRRNKSSPRGTSQQENPLQGTLQCCPFLQGQLCGRKIPDGEFRRWLKYVFHPDDEDAGKGLIGSCESGSFQTISTHGPQTAVKITFEIAARVSEHVGRQRAR